MMNVTGEVEATSAAAAADADALVTARVDGWMQTVRQA